MMAKYPDVFQHSSMENKVFYKFYAQVCTRCFGWGLPTTAMIPMADNCNHSDVTVVQEIIHKGMQMQGKRDTQYFTKTKFMNDYSINFNEVEQSDFSKQIKGYFNETNYEANKKFTKVDQIKNNINNGIQLWDLPCIRETYTEDNDTEEESDEEETKSNAAMLNLMSNILTDRKATVKDLKKGFVFFIDQEKKDIERYAKIERAMNMTKKTEEVFDDEEAGGHTGGPPVKQWWEDVLYFRPITEWTLQKNEWLEFGEHEMSHPPYEAQVYDPDSEDIGDRLNSDETDEEFDWFEPEIHTDDTYFNLVNKNRKNFEVGD